MFKKILIANRGEIACRVIKTARRMGIATVAVYSDADARARHVRLADEAIRIGPATAHDSYLCIPNILDAARATGADGIHPGYGFLSENAGFAEACAQAGVVFIGPPVAAIRAMGSKSAAKTLMQKAAVPLTPGYHGDDQSPALLANEAARIGYPVLIKASAGGGGKGMRRVDAPADFLAALASCRREALSAFNDDRVLVEQYLLKPRHIEMQVFGDQHGGMVYLFERDCSVQRRHQKVLEEAPAPGMTPERRAVMGQVAVDAARAVGYVGAGTVEFIVHQDGSFYFMEMNTRLQVEHPVTEMITGLDLVEWQLRVACNEPLPLTQAQLSFQGHALEARVYAEDPDKGFLPSTGRLTHLVQPVESDQVRVDTGVEQGDVITPYYDPMIAKLVVHGDDREQALARMRQALAQYRVVGVSNNVDFLTRLIDTPSFAHADLDTGLIEREHTRLFPPEIAVPPYVWLLAALAEHLRDGQDARQHAAHSPDPDSPWHAQDGWRLNQRAWQSLTLRLGEITQEIGITTTPNGHWLTVDGRDILGQGTLDTRGELRAELDGQHVRATVLAEGERRHVFFQGHSWPLLRVDTLHTWEVSDALEASLRAPMSGKVIALMAQPGIALEQGAPLLVLEAMKMEHTLVAPRKGVIKSFLCAVGEQVADGDELVDFEGAE